jgi:hexokinase
MNALINDTEATLMSHAFANPATSVSLILGTGLNAALQLPLSAFSPLKIDGRPKEWVRRARTVLVNTEISMFGAGIFPLSVADKRLDTASTNPGFQPLEQLTSGRYLGEICRLIIDEGVKAGALFGGVMPVGMRTRFGFDTGNMAVLETYVSAHSPKYGKIDIFSAVDPLKRAYPSFGKLSTVVPPLQEKMSRWFSQSAKLYQSELRYILP